MRHSHLSRLASLVVLALVLAGYSGAQGINDKLAHLEELAETGDPEHIDTLYQATQSDNWYQRSMATDALLALAAQMARTGHEDAAADVYRKLFRERTSPSDTYVRCAAVHGLGTIAGRGTARDLVDALGDKNVQVRAAAIEAAAGLSGLEAASVLVPGYQELPPRGKIAMLRMFVRRGGAEADMVVTQGLRADNPAVRAAAMQAAGDLGLARSVDRLVRALEDEHEEVRTAARAALVSMSGSAAVEALLSRLTDTDPVVRESALEVLAERTGDVPIQPIIAATKDEKHAVRMAAYEALGALAGPGDLPQVLTCVVAAGTDAERARAVKAAVAVYKRGADAEQAGALAAGMLSGQSVPARRGLLRVLGHVGGEHARQALLAAARSDDARIRLAAARALLDWPDATVADDILALLDEDFVQTERMLLVHAYTQMIELPPARPIEATVAMCERALEAARPIGHEPAVMQTMACVHHPRIVELLATRLPDAALHHDAAAALVELADGAAPQAPAVAEAAIAALADLALEPARQERVDAARERLERFAGYITDWWVAGPYAIEGKAGHDLLDVQFPPEPGGAAVDWQRLPPDPDAAQRWMVNLDRVMPGANRAGYLRTHVDAPREMAARLELGSDDGVKVWLNGEVVHRNPALRGVAPGDDVVPVTLRAGANTLLIKVTNDGGPWGACARFRAPEGGGLPGLHVTAGERP